MKQKSKRRQEKTSISPRKPNAVHPEKPPRSYPAPRRKKKASVDATKTQASTSKQKHISKAPSAAIEGAVQVGHPPSNSKGSDADGLLVPFQPNETVKHPTGPSTPYQCAVQELCTNQQNVLSHDPGTIERFRGPQELSEGLFSPKEHDPWVERRLDEAIHRLGTERASTQDPSLMDAYLDSNEKHLHQFENAPHQASTHVDPIDRPGMIGIQDKEQRSRSPVKLSPSATSTLLEQSTDEVKQPGSASPSFLDRVAWSSVPVLAPPAPSH